MVQLLLRRGADPNRSSLPQPPLLMAVQRLDVDIVRELLLAGADPQVELTQAVRCCRVTLTFLAHLVYIV